MICSLEKSLVGLIVITVSDVSMLAAKPILEPLALVSLSSMRLSTLVLSISSLPIISLIASVKVSVMSESLAISVAESAGRKVIDGAVVSVAPISRTVKVAEDALMALFASSSTLLLIAT